MTPAPAARARVAPATVTLAVCTYLRNADLVRTLTALAEQAAEVAADVDLLVVDNDPDAGARASVETFAATTAAGGRGVAVRYVHEPTPGIAAARNRCLDEARRDLLVFVDDDEHPRPDWLRLLLAEHARTGAAAVAGPVESEFEAPLDPWIAAGGFFTRGRFPTGSSRPVAATNNLLLDRAAVVDLGLRFDDRFGLTGGSDTMFTRTLTRRGASIVWCAEAVMVDRTPPERATRAWVLRRIHRFGNVTARIAILEQPHAVGRLRARLRMLAAGSARVVTGAGQAGLGVVTGSVRARARGRRRLSFGTGYLAAALGRVHAEYLRPGSPR